MPGLSGIEDRHGSDHFVPVLYVPATNIGDGRHGFQDTRKPLGMWFRAMWYVASQKNGASALGLQRILGWGVMRLPGRGCIS